MTLKEKINNEFSGEFWTRKDELIFDIEQMEEGIAVVFDSDEYLSVAHYDTDEEIIIYLGHANSTMWIEKIEEA